MQKLIFTNGGGQSIDLTSGNFGITNWEGLSGAELNIQTQQVPFQDGGVFLDALIEQREVSVTVAIQDNNNLSLRYELKRQLISALNPKLGEGVLVYTNDYLSRQIKAVPQLPIFENKNSNDAGTLKASVVFSCPSPYWEDLEESEITFNNLQIIENNGDVPIGIEGTISFNASNPILINQTSGKKIKVNGDIGKYIDFNTNTGKKSVVAQDVKLKYIGANFSYYCCLFNDNKYFYGGNVILRENLLTGEIKIIRNQSNHDIRAIGFYTLREGVSRYFAVGDGTILTSENGEDWTELLSSGSWYDMCQLGEHCYCVGEESIASFSESSTNKRDLSIGYLKSITSANGKIYVAVNDYNVSYIYVGEDEYSLTLVYTKLGTQLTKIRYFNNLIIAVGTNGEIITSADGESWAEQTSGTGQQLNGIIFYDDKYIIGAGYAEGYYVLISENAINWEIKNCDFRLWNMAYGKTDLIAVAGDSWNLSSTTTNGVYKSENGENWRLKEGFNIGTGERENTTSLIFTHNKFITAMEKIKISEDNGESWQTVLDRVGYFLFKNKEIVFCGGIDSLCRSQNGIDWTQANIDTSLNGKYLTGMTFGAGKYVIVGYKQSPATPLIYTSTDSDNWTRQLNIPSTIKRVNSVAYGNNKYVALGYTSGMASRLIVSSNAQDWTIVSLTNVPNDIIFQDGYFIGVGNSGFIIISEDGENWENVSSGVSYNFNKILYCNKMYIITSQQNILVSYDRKYWYEVEDILANFCVVAGYGKGETLLLGKLGIVVKFDDVVAENIIAHLSQDSDMDLKLDVGTNRVLFTDDDNAFITLKYRQKYIGV